MVHKKIFSLVLIAALWASGIAAHRSSYILDESGKPTQTLLETLSYFKVQHDGTLKSIIAATQKAWIRPAGSERWDLEESSASEKEAAMPFLKKLGMIEMISPEKKEYEACVIFGATLRSVQLRFAYAIDLFKKGIRFKKIIFLGGERPRNDKVESKEDILDREKSPLAIRADWQMVELPKTEHELIKMVYEQADMPKEMAAIPVIFINTPMQKTPDGKECRPITLDTVRDLVNRDIGLKYESCLFISSQPYAGYQESIARSVIKDAAIEVVGPISMHTKLSVYLDTIARWLYAEGQRRLG